MSVHDWLFGSLDLFFVLQAAILIGGVVVALCAKGLRRIPFARRRSDAGDRIGDSSRGTLTPTVKRDWLCVALRR